MMENEETGVKFIVLGVLAIVVLVLFAIFSPFVIIGAGERGVVTNWGAVSGVVMNEGMGFRTPIMQEVHKISVREVRMDVEALAYSKDIQTVDSKITLNYFIRPEGVNNLYQKVRMDWESVIIAPAIQEAVKATTAKYTAQELIEKRNEVKEGIKVALTERLAPDNITVKEVSITDFSFSDAFEKSVEAKQVAQQDALTAKNKLEQVKFEADQRVAQAEAEAEAIKIQASAITSQGGEDYVKLQWIEAWRFGGAKVPSFITSDNGSSFLMNIGN